MKFGQKKHTLSWLTMILLAVNLILVAALLLSYLAPVVNPQSFSLPALLGLFYPILFIINFIFLVGWILRKRWLFIISLITLLLGWNVFFKHFTFGPEQKADNGQTILHVVSYNVRIFDVHHWRPGDKTETRDSIKSLLNKLNADVVCFQEFFHGEQNYFPTIQPLRNSLNTPYFHTDIEATNVRNKHFGLATFSVYPIINKGIIKFSGAKANAGIFSDVLIDEDTIRFFNIHLESIKFSNSDHQFMSDFMEPGVNPSTSSGKVIFSKLKNAFINRSIQAQTVKEFIEKSPHPVILCGDFNDTPSSFAYNTVKGNLNDAFLESGFGFGTTYADGIPFLRIDYILHSKQLTPSDFKIHNVHFSDHYPVSAYFGLD